MYIKKVCTLQIMYQKLMNGRLSDLQLILLYMTSVRCTYTRTFNIVLKFVCVCVCHTADETLEKYKNNVNCLRQYVV